MSLSTTVKQLGLIPKSVTKYVQNTIYSPLLLTFFIISLSACQLQNHQLRPTGDLGVIIGRATGSIQIVNTTQQEPLAKVDKLGDLSHASVVFSRDQRYAYIFARDGGLTKIDLLQDRIDHRIIQSGNSIGGAISQNGKWIAVSNYTPGGIKIFSADTLELVADITATPLSTNTEKKVIYSKVVGLVDAPGNRFVFSLFDTNEIWVADYINHDNNEEWKVKKYPKIGKQPYDALITPNGRYYIAGLFGESGFALLDLWHLEKGVKQILPNYNKNKRTLPVYKMPHLEGWAMAGHYAFVPAVGQHNILVIDTERWQQIATIPVHGQPVFAVARPDGRQVWVNFAYPNNNTIQVINTETYQVVHQFMPGQAALHMSFTPKGEQLWLSVRDSNEVQVYDPTTFKKLAAFSVDSPSGIFFTSRAHQIGL
ncbi:protein nirF [Endozoicomonas sp. SM1973]|uniref:Protein nirF n=2 Tax=Spartinivicinus marinus TaxID=2994442 RepID=A0A853HXN3_9GAMM|nr:protein nirF [Spartinivicinus marinus]